MRPRQSRPRRSAARAALAGAALALLSACSGTADPRACPHIQVVGDLSRLVQFRDGGGRDPSDVAYLANIDDVRSGCAYDKTGVTVQMTVTISADRGPAGGRLPGADITYFVAITDAARNVIAKQPFNSRLDFSGSHGVVTDELEQRIPIAPTVSAGDYAIILGFQLTPEQIDFNEKRPGG